MMTERKRDKLAVELAQNYLLGLDKRITPSLLSKYLQPDPRPGSLPEIYEHILESAQNADRVSGVIKGGVGKISNLKPVLCEFQPAAILKTYTAWEQVLDAIIGKFPKGKFRTAPNAIWPRFCRAILSAANFLSGFQDAGSFYKFADLFDCDDRARLALPLILASCIKGLGFALACDYIKELGYPNYAKADRQLIKIFMALRLSASDDPYKVFCDIVRVAKHARATPYAVDKIFWLIGSGKFYKDGFSIGSQKEQFIKLAKRELR